MKILMIITDLAKGGRERRMLELIKGLTGPAGNHEIYLVLMRDMVEYDYVYDLPIRFSIVPKKGDKDFLYVFRLRKIIREFQPDIIHSWDVTASIYATLAKTFLNIPLINGFIANAPSKIASFDKRLLRIKVLNPFCKAVVSNSKAGLLSYQIPGNKGVYIYNGVDFTRFENLKPAKALAEEILGHPKDGFFVAAMVATFDKRKDYPTLLDAAISICAVNPRMTFLLVGAGPDLKANMEKVPVELINKQIFFLGKRNDIESLLQITDAGILITNPATHGEGISNSIIEYMASGKPVIATRGGGTDEIVLNEKNGLLIDPGSPSQIIEALEKLQKNDELRNSMGRYAYQWVREVFDVSVVTNRYVDLYKRFVKGSKAKVHS